MDASRGATRGTRELNIVYDEHEERGFFALNLFAFGLTLFLVLVLAAAIVITLAVPVVLNMVSLGSLPDSDKRATSSR